jgi:glucan-binding YG repeat protein
MNKNAIRVNLQPKTVQAFGLSPSNSVEMSQSSTLPQSVMKPPSVPQSSQSSFQSSSQSSFQSSSQSSFQSSSQSSFQSSSQSSFQSNSQSSFQSMSIATVGAQPQQKQAMSDAEPSPARHLVSPLALQQQPQPQQQQKQQHQQQQQQHQPAAMKHEIFQKENNFEYFGIVFMQSGTQRICLQVVETKGKHESPYALLTMYRFDSSQKWMVEGEQHNISTTFVDLFNEEHYRPIEARVK